MRSREFEVPQPTTFPGCSAGPTLSSRAPGEASEDKGAIGFRVGQLVDELVTHAAARTLRTQYSTFCELGKIALGGGGTDVSQMRVLSVGHSAHKPTSARIEQGVEDLPLPVVKGRLSMTHPEVRFLQNSLNCAGTLTASGDHLFEEPSQPLASRRDRRERVLEARRSTRFARP